MAKVSLLRPMVAAISRLASSIPRQPWLRLGRVPSGALAICSARMRPRYVAIVTKMDDAADLPPNVVAIDPQTSTKSWTQFVLDGTQGRGQPGTPERKRGVLLVDKPEKRSVSDLAGPKH